MANHARFETRPTMKTIGDTPESERRVPTGEFYWHHRDANGRITFTGGENFTTRHDAHRAIAGAVEDAIMAAFAGDMTAQVSVKPEALPILDFDENGDVVRPEPR